MGKILLFYVLFFVVSTTLETEVKKKNASKLW